MNTTLLASVLVKVTQNKPSSCIDAIVLFCHFNLIENDYSCKYIHNEQLETTNNSLKSNWNSISSCYSFKYIKETKEYYLRILPIESSILIIFGDIETMNTRLFQRDLNEYFPNDKSIDDILGLTNSWQLFGDEFYNFINNNDNKKSQKHKKEEKPSSSLQINSNIVHPEEPNYPFAPRYEGHHPGMVVGPNNPIFGSDPLRIDPEPRRPRNPNIPNPRFDPFGPIPGSNINRGPNPDHLGFPPDSMFM